MNSRDPQLLEMRPRLSGTIIFSGMSSEELFQNKTLRPIIEFQRDLFVSAFKNYIEKHKNVYYSFNLEKKMDYINNALLKDIKFRNSLKGMVIGQFTIDEYSAYIENSSSLNKRMMTLVRESLLENIQLLDMAV